MYWGRTDSDINILLLMGFHIFIDYLGIPHHKLQANSLLVLPVMPPPTLVIPQRNEENKIEKKFNFCCPYTHWSMV